MDAPPPLNLRVTAAIPVGQLHSDAGIRSSNGGAVRTRETDFEEARAWVEGIQRGNSGESGPTDVEIKACTEKPCTIAWTLEK